MTNFIKPSFSVALNLGDKGRENYERIFGKKKPKHNTAKKPKTKKAK